MMVGGFNAGSNAMGTEQTTMKEHLPKIAAALSDDKEQVDPASIKLSMFSTQVVAGTNYKYSGTAGKDGRKFEAMLFEPLPCNVKEGEEPKMQFQSASWVDLNSPMRTSF